uniref:Uncharacterized protein n=1 Tax=Euplotes harpa TaxID=151035 RepID=A0A7S3JD74_9SPIT|mmetsp:Transcript_33534/g.38514  ORF Transcript_33534/g.38514 Transcript_33534/m.38514 type:complete len:134 (+) Transcript_33534:1327-1728(+)
MAQASIEHSDETDIRDFQGIQIKEGTKIFIYPSFGVTMKEIQDKIVGYCKISKRSVLILRGENTILRDVNLDSTLVTHEESGIVEGEFIEQNYVEYQNIDPQSDDVDGMLEVIKIRGFKTAINAPIEGLNVFS